jgi:hypothetical protein
MSQKYSPEENTSIYPNPNGVSNLIDSSQIPIQKFDTNLQRDKIIVNENKEKNIEKFLFFEFLIDTTKIEIHMERLQSYLFWQGLMEYLLWLVLIACFVSSPRSMTKIWVFSYHIARATIGLLILKYIPKTFQIIDNLVDYENTSLEDIQIQMENNYVNLISGSEKVLKPLLCIYFLLTLISIIVDVVMFFVIASEFRIVGMEHRKFAFLVGVVGFIICDFVYFSFFFSLKYSFPSETLAPVKKATIGFFTDLKNGISSGISSVVKRFKIKIASGVINRIRQR